MRCLILQGFPFSPDGIDVVMADKDAMIDLPERLVPGLERAGFVSRAAETIADVRALETAASTRTPVVKTETAEEELARVRDEYETAVGKRAYWGWSVDELRQKMAEAK